MDIVEGKSRLKVRRASPQTITDDQIEAFFETLAETCNVVRSAKAAGFSANWAYRRPVALRVPTGTINVRVEGSLTAEGITSRNGFILRGDGNAVLYAPVGGDTYFYSASSGIFHFNNMANAPHTSVDNAGNWNYSGNLNLGAAAMLNVNGNQVVGARGAAVADATDAASAITQLNALLARLRAHGLIAA